MLAKLGKKKLWLDQTIFTARCPNLSPATGVQCVRAAGHGGPCVGVHGAGKTTCTWDQQREEDVKKHNLKSLRDV